MSRAKTKVKDPDAPSAEVRFGTPPPARARYDWVEIARKAKARPMEWGEVFKQDMVAIRNSIAQGHTLPVHPALGFETRTANNTRGRPATEEDPGEPRLCDLWIRFNPDLRNDTVATIIEQRF
jgi:hypothetical protein